MTTTATPPPAWAPLEAALRQRRPVRLSYKGSQRVVCPHALGWKNGRAMLLAYQTDPHTTTGAPPAHPKQGWRNMFVDHIDQVLAADPASKWHTADNYNHVHPFNSIDNLTIAIPPADLPPRLGTTRREPEHPL